MVENEIKVKVVLLGNPSVGKSSILQKYVTGNCGGNNENTVGAKFMGKTVYVGDKIIKLNIWDTAGQERYQSFSRLYCRDAGSLILVFDVTDPESLEGMKKWYEIMSQDVLPENSIVFVVGNKCDLIEKANSFEDNAIEFSDSIKAEYFRVSAFSGMGIDELFTKVSTKYLQNMNFEKRNSIYLERKTSVVIKKKKKRFC